MLYKIGKFQLFGIFPKVYVFGHIRALIKVNLTIFFGFLAFGIVSSFGEKLTNVGGGGIKMAFQDLCSASKKKKERMKEKYENLNLWKNCNVGYLSVAGRDETRSGYVRYIPVILADIPAHTRFIDIYV